MHSGREEIHLPGASVVPDEMEDSGAGDDSLIVADPPGAVLSTGGRRAARVEGGGGHPQRLAEVELVRRRHEQDFVDPAVRESERGDSDPAGLVDGEVGLEVDHAVVGSRRDGPGPGPTRRRSATV